MLRLFHISDTGNIQTFIPRQSPSHFDAIKGEVVFAISDKLIHNYLLPRDCPRVTYYAGEHTSQADREQFLKHNEFVIATEGSWKKQIQQATLYCYELPANTFELLDECAGYYISYEEVKPLAVTIIDNCIVEIESRKVSLQFIPNLWDLHERVKGSSLNFSMIRMRNATAP